MFGLLGGIQAKVIIGLVVVIAVMAGAFYWYFTYSQEQIQILAANSAKLELAVETQTNTIKKMIENQQRSAAEMRELNAKIRTSDNKNRDLIKLLAKHRDNMSNIIEGRATLYERIINKGTKRVLDGFETLTDPESYNENFNSNTPE